MKLKELSNNILSFSIREYFCCDWSEDDKIFVINADGIDIHHFKPNPKSKHKWCEFQRSFILATPTNLIEFSGYDDSIILSLPKMDLFRALSDPLVTPEFKFNTPIPAAYKRASWSPIDVLSTKNCLLAALTTFGSVRIFLQVSEWITVLDISHIIYLHVKKQDLLRKKEKNSTQTLDNIRFNSWLLVSTALAWSDVVYHEKQHNYSYFTTAQKCGTVFIWRFDPDENDDDVVINTHLELELCINLKDICVTYWITISESLIYLIIGSNKGFIKRLQIKKTGKHLELIKIDTIWNEDDDLAVVKIISKLLYDGSTYCLAIKGSFLLTFTVHENCSDFNIQYKNFGNLQITGLQKSNDGCFYLATLTGTLFRLEISLNEDKIPCLKSDILESDINYNIYAQYGFCSSKNNAFWCLFLNPCRVTKKYHGKSWSRVFVAYMDDLNPLKCLANNKSQLLTYQWDILDLLRVLKCKDLYDDPEIDKYLDVKNCKSLYEVKLCFWLNTIYHETLKAEIITNDLNKIILSHHANNYLKKLIHDYKNTSRLSKAQLETVSLQYKLIDKDFNTSDFELLSSMEGLPEIVKRCEWCDEVLVYPICSQNHSREFCCVTFREVDSLDVLKCPLCDAVAHKDLKNEELTCTFCDSKLEYLTICKKD